MTTQFRTLLLLGLTGIAGSLSGCILETSSGSNGYGGGPPSSNCLDSQYFSVQWEVDNGDNTTALGCGQITAHVELTLNTSPSSVIEVGVQSCNNQFYNFSGASQSGLAVGTAVTAASLISDSTASAGQVLSTAVVPPNQQVAIAACTTTQLSFSFPLQ